MCGVWYPCLNFEFTRLFWAAKFVSWHIFVVLLWALPLIWFQGYHFVIQISCMQPTEKNCFLRRTSYRKQILHSYKECSGKWIWCATGSAKWQLEPDRPLAAPSGSPALFCRIIPFLHGLATLCHPIPGYCWHGSSESESGSGKWRGGWGGGQRHCLFARPAESESFIDSSSLTSYCRLVESDSLCCPNQMAWDNLLFRSLLQILIQVLACVQLL